jgi:hypothetical protein
MLHIIQTVFSEVYIIPWNTCGIAVENSVESVDKCGKYL